MGPTKKASTAIGLHLKAQKPFDTVSITGDCSFREIPQDINQEDIMISHSHVDNRDAEKDFNKTITEKIRPPRSISLKWPFAHTFGEPFVKNQHRQIIHDTLYHLKNIKEPGTIVDLFYP